MTVRAEAQPGRAEKRAESIERPRSRGWRIVAAKELADNLSGPRFVVLLAILALVAALPVYSVASEIQNIASAASGQAALFLRLFTVSAEPLPSFFTLMAFFIPLLGIAFGFDAVNSERSQGTLPRLLSQPLYRDDVINGKFVAGLTVIVLIVIALTAMVAGIGLVRLGIVPGAEEVVRLLAWMLVTIIYAAFWLGFATLCSVGLRRAASSALAAVGLWIGLTLFGSLVAQLVAGFLAPISSGATVAQQVHRFQLEQTLSRLSPGTLYSEATAVLLNPSIRTLGVVTTSQQDRAIPSLLSLDQSLLLVWPQAVALIALTVLSFAAAYVLFLRQEVRA